MVGAGEAASVEKRVIRSSRWGFLSDEGVRTRKSCNCRDSRLIWLGWSADGGMGRARSWVWSGFSANRN